MIRKHSESIILTIIWLISIYSLTITIVKNYEIGISNYIGYILLVAITILTIIKFRNRRTVIAIFLLIGSFNLFQFTYSTTTLFFSLSIFGKAYSSIGLQPVCLTLLFFFVLINRSEVTSTLKKIILSVPNKKQKEQNIENEFYQKIKEKPDSDLLKIIENKKDYQAEFINAAKKVITERKTNQTSL